MQNTITIFCANEQAELEHTIDIDGNGEITLICTTCGRCIKTPAGTDAQGVKDYTEKHKLANKGQRSVEAQEAEKENLLEELTQLSKEPQV